MGEGFREELGQLTDSYTTKEKPVFTLAIVNHFYVLREGRDSACHLMNAPLTSLCQQDNWRVLWVRNHAGNHNYSDS